MTIKSLNFVILQKFQEKKLLKFSATHHLEYYANRNIDYYYP